ncbi:hypothetical protein CTI12_AA127950 [Artemisia annua]|uniref:KIB1-4 beta-propeller domain-containing protein n=1 Tax=Artemisia annua TaxID=35608 RepID=A0A2U1NZG3_ARTAN|nr:hypothetical protein CTI12_AA127950 [Artemisia annua]
MPEDQIFYTIHNPQLLYRCRIPELIGTQIRACFHGWVVLAKHPAWFLWNPLTSKLIRLPPLIHMKVEPDQCCLSSPPDDPNSVFLLVTHRVHSTNGFMHFGGYLKGYCSELFYIQIDLEGETRETAGDVHLYKLDMSNMAWEKMEDLKDAIFFIQVDSQYPVYYSPVITSELAGYIHIVDRMGKLLYSYHVKNRTISIASMSSLVPTSDMSSWGMLECTYCILHDP